MSEIIGITTDKQPLIKKLTEHNIINLTGESGSGKSTFAQNYNKDFIIVDTDVIFGNQQPTKIYEIELKDYFQSKYQDNFKTALYTNFDEIYDDILKYFSQEKRTIVIDSAQFRNIKNVRKLKGTVIILRTSIKTCLSRCIIRYHNNHPEATKQEVIDYANHKKEMLKSSKYLNDFIEKIIEL